MAVTLDTKGDLTASKHYVDRDSPCQVSSVNDLVRRPEGGPKGPGRGDHVRNPRGEGRITGPVGLGLAGQVRPMGIPEAIRVHPGRQQMGADVLHHPMGDAVQASQQEVEPVGIPSSPLRPTVWRGKRAPRKGMTDLAPALFASTRKIPARHYGPGAEPNPVADMMADLAGFTFCAHESRPS